MDDKKQIEKKAIEEMACDMCTVILNCNEPHKPIPSCYAYQHAKRAYVKGYRKQKEGRWKGAGLGDYYCSLCCSTYSGGEDYNYCPNCGAHMKGGEQE